MGNVSVVLSKGCEGNAWKRIGRLGDETEQPRREVNGAEPQRIGEELRCGAMEMRRNAVLRVAKEKLRKATSRNGAAQISGEEPRNSTE